MCLTHTHSIWNHKGKQIPFYWSYLCFAHKRVTPGHSQAHEIHISRRFLKTQFPSVCLGKEIGPVGMERMWTVLQLWTSPGIDISNLLFSLTPRWRGRQGRQDGLSVTRFIKESGPGWFDERICTCGGCTGPSSLPGCPGFPAGHCLLASAARPLLSGSLSTIRFLQPSVFICRKRSAWGPSPTLEVAARSQRPQVGKDVSFSCLLLPVRFRVWGRECHSALRTAENPVGGLGG